MNELPSTFLKKKAIFIDKESSGLPRVVAWVASDDKHGPPRGRLWGRNSGLDVEIPVLFTEDVFILFFSPADILANIRLNFNGKQNYTSEMGR